MATKHRQSIVVPKEEDSYIPEYTLDRIEEEVCKNISGMEYTHWENAIKICIEIEREPLDIYRCLNTTVSTYGISDKDTQNIDQRIKTILLRIYMLLYYHHRNDKIYEMSVFPPLREYVCRCKNCNNYNFSGMIVAPLNKIIDLEREVRELREKNSHTDNGSTVEDRKKIVLTNQSEMARVVKAMYMAGYFKNSDGSNVSEAEVGRKLCADFGLKSTWDSMVQAAYKKESIAETFDTLKDKAVEHYKKVNKIL